MQARVTDSTGTVDYFDLLSASEPRYLGTWSAPANDTAEDHEYEVHITAYDGEGQSDFVRVWFTVAGTPPEISRLTLSQRRLSFGPTRVGKAVRKSVVLRNAGTATVECTVRSPGRRFRLPGGRDLALTLAPGEAAGGRAVSGGGGWAALVEVAGGAG